MDKISNIFNNIDTVCCRGPVDSGYCVCTHNEMALRRYAHNVNDTLPAMTDQQRSWCIDQCVDNSEGYYDYSELSMVNDQQLANAVLNSWSMYIRSNMG